MISASRRNILVGLSVLCLPMFGRHSFVNLSNDSRELVLESECQVFL